jgi:hypothetical protein
VIGHRLLPVDGSAVMFMLVRTTTGRPTGYPMTAIFQQGEMVITTYRKAAKARHLLADGRVCCVFPDPAAPGRGVAVYGRAVPTEAETVPLGDAGAPSPMEVPPEVRDKVRARLASAQRMVMRIDVDRLSDVGTGAGGGVDAPA